MTQVGDIVPDAEEFPFRGSVIWLTPEQGGRAAGPPLPRPQWPYYAATAYVPRRTAATGLASFVLRGSQPGQWRSQAEGRWLIFSAEGNQAVQQGSVILITEEREASPSSSSNKCPLSAGLEHPLDAPAAAMSALSRQDPDKLVACLCCRDRIPHFWCARTSPAMTPDNR
jgi:hypothetical protein